MLTKINLLPQEYRRKEMTPMGVFLPIVVALALVVASGFFWGWLHFAALAKAEGDRDALQGAYAAKLPTLAYLESLRTEESVYKQRTDTIAEIAASRTLWCKKLDQFCDVVADDDSGDRYLIRIDDLTVKEPVRRVTRRANSGPSEGEVVTIKGYAFNNGDPLYDYNVFHEALGGSPFFQGDFLSISKPEGQVERPDADLQPNKAWVMKMDLVMKGKSSKKAAGRKKRPAPRRASK